MANRMRAVYAGVLALAAGTARAQTPAGLDSFLTQAFAPADANVPPTPAEWSATHPGEAVDAPSVHIPTPAEEWDRQQALLQGRWCARSAKNIDLGGGVHVYRIALFYPPNVELDPKPLPPLPVESGAALRDSGCRLGRVLHEFNGEQDAAALAETIQKRMPGMPLAEGDGKGGDFWEKRAWSSRTTFYYLLLHTWKNVGIVAGAMQAPALVLESDYFDGYQPPSAETITPGADEPWLMERAAKLAGLPLALTLNMLDFGAPRKGGPAEVPDMHCAQRLVPALRAWLSLASQLPAQRRAAALLVADQVAENVDRCAEFSGVFGSTSTIDPNVWLKEKESLLHDLHALGIKTGEGRLGLEYSGNLRAQAHRLAPNGPADELYRMAQLEDGCGSPVRDGDCAAYRAGGEQFLARYPNDEWSATVHLLVAQAYALDAMDDELSGDQAAKLLGHALEHYRAWFPMANNERNRRLVWQEIWALEAGLRAWLPESAR